MNDIWTNPSVKKKKKKNLQNTDGKESEEFGDCKFYWC